MGSAVTVNTTWSPSVTIASTTRTVTTGAPVMSSAVFRLAFPTERDAPPICTDTVFTAPTE